jgi:NAD dependent epimerase/dehydratase
MSDWKGRRVLVTGADGFIGSHLVEALLSAGAMVRALSLYNSFNDWGWLELVEKTQSLEVVSGDVRDSDICDGLVEGCEIVFHLAALIPIPYSYVAPSSYVDVNVGGTLNLLQAARRHRVARFVQTSTSEVYGTARYVPIDEAHPLQPQSPYAATKVGADSLAISFQRSFGLPVVVARPFNTYGPRQSARAVVPTIVSQLLNGPTLKLGNLTATRDLTFVEDTCRGFMLVASLEEGLGEVFNIGTNTEISVGDLCQKIAAIMGSGAPVIVQDEVRLRPSTSEVDRLRCDFSKLRTAAGYVPSVSLEEGLRRTIEWMRQPDVLRGYKPEIYNV